MTGFELLDHTSEVGFRAEGQTLEEAFENAGTALFEIMTDTEEIETTHSVELSVESKDLEALLYDFIDDLIYRTEAEKMFLAAFDLSIEPMNRGYRLDGTGRGEPISMDMRRQEVKAPTYSDIRIEETDDGWVIEMFVDV